MTVNKYYHVTYEHIFCRGDIHEIEFTKVFSTVNIKFHVKCI